MKRDLIDALASPQSDPEFGGKYLIALLATATSVLILPAILLMGYMAQTIKHASAGKKGLPEWKDVPELAIQGGICTLSALYMLPAALLFAIGYLPRMMGGNDLFSLGAILNRFIAFGALIVGLGGLAFTLTAMHSYLETRQLSSLFNIKAILAKLRANSTEMSMLLSGIGAVCAVLVVVNLFLGFIGVLLSVVVGAYVAILMAYGTGSIFAAEDEASTPALTAADVVIADVAATEVVVGLTGETTSAPETDVFGDIPEEDVWKPK